MPGREPDLVAVGGVARRGRRRDLALGELALHRLGEGNRRVGRARHAHRLIDVAASRERVADRAAQTGGRAAERFDLGGVVVRLVFKHEQPVLLLAVHIHLDFHRAGVDLLALVEVGELPLRLERLRADHREVHQRHRLLFPGIELVPQGEVFFKALFDVGGLDLHVFQVGEEGRVAAVVRPVGVDHADLGDGRVAALGVFKVVLAEGDVVGVHREPVAGDEVRQPRRVERGEAVECFHRRGDVVFDVERFGQLERREAAFHRVDEIVLDRVERVRRDAAREDVHPRGTHDRLFLGGGEGDALGAGIGALVELAGQVLDREDLFARRGGGELVVGQVDLRLGKDRAARGVEVGPVDPFNVVAVEDAHALDAVEHQYGAQVAEDSGRLHGKLRFFLHVDSVNAHWCSSRSFIL